MNKTPLVKPVDPVRQGGNDGDNDDRVQVCPPADPLPPEEPMPASQPGPSNGQADEAPPLSKADSVEERNAERDQVAASRRRKSVAAFMFSVACVTTAVIAVSYFVVHKDRREATTAEPEEYPAVPGILQAFMKPTEDPCHDFYNFTCGSYNHPSGQTLDQMQHEMIATLFAMLLTVNVPASNQSAAQKAAKLYKTCVRGTDDTAALMDFLTSVGLTAKSYKQADALDKILLLFFKYNINTLLGLLLAEARVASMKRRIAITVNLKRQLSFEKRVNGSPDFYREHLKVFGHPPNEQEIKDLVERVTKAEKIDLMVYFKIFSADTENITVTTVQGLDGLMSSLPANRWSLLVSNHSGGAYGEDDRVEVIPGVLRYLERLYAELGGEDLSLLTAWELLVTIVPLTNHYKSGRLYSLPDIITRCLMAPLEAMEVPLLSWYLFSEVPQTTVDASRALTQRIKDTMLKEIRDSNWLDSATKSTAMDKVKSMGLHVGYPKYFGSDQEIDEVYSSYPDVGDSFLTPWLTAMQKTIEWKIKNHTSFRFSMQVPKAKYDPYLNKIVIPATLLLPPLFVPGNSTALSYGGLGAYVAHEMTHAIDVQGSQWDGQGNQRDWWSPQSREEGTQRMTCLRQSHGVATDEQDAENTADFAGLVSAHNAYSGLSEQEKVEELKYSSEQLFFISSCIKCCSTKSEAAGFAGYAPFRERCNVPLKNMEAFARAFNCPRKSAMNPHTRCSFW